MQTRSMSSRIIATALSLLLVVGFLPISQSTAYAEPASQSEATQSTGADEGASTEGESSSGSSESNSSENNESTEGGSSSSGSSGSAVSVSSSSNEVSEISEGGDLESSSENGLELLAGTGEYRDSETFDANSNVVHLALTLESDGTKMDYEAEGGETIDTTKDFPNGLSRTASYTATIAIDTKAMLQAQKSDEYPNGKYPFVKGDTVTCSMPDLILSGQGEMTSGRLRDNLSKWDEEHNGVGDYSITRDDDGHNVLTFTYDDGYIDENNGRITETSVSVTGSFDATGAGSESFDKELVFGDITAKVTFAKYEIVHNLSIEKTGTTLSRGPKVQNSSPEYPRDGSADIDSNGYLQYQLTVTAGADNTSKLTNVKVTDLFDDESASKVDLSSMKLVSVKNNNTDTTKAATEIKDENGNLIGWNIGDLEVGAKAVVTYKIKLNKDGVTAAVDAAKKAASQERQSTDAADARTIKNTATAQADDTDAVTDDYSTIVANYLTTKKTTGDFDYDTQRQYFTITISSPADNRYTMHDVPIYDWLTSSGDSEWYAKNGAGIKSITVKHADGSTEDLTWSKFLNASNTSWRATISEIRPGDTVTVTSYLTFTEDYWKIRYENYWFAGDIQKRINKVYVGNAGDTTDYQAPDLNRAESSSGFQLYKTLLAKHQPSVTADGHINWEIYGNEPGKSKVAQDFGGQTITDTLGPDQVFEDGTAYVYFYDDFDGEPVFTDKIQLHAGDTSFSYTIPEEYGTYGYKITYTSKITDWDSYVGVSKKYENTVGIGKIKYKSNTQYRGRVAIMEKNFVEQAAGADETDGWAKWTTSITYSLHEGDTYTDVSRQGVSFMYFNQADLDGIALTIDGVAVDKGLYEIAFADDSSDDKHSAYKITFKGTVSVEKDGATLTPSKDTPLVVSYQSHIVDPDSGQEKLYYNDATLEVKDGDNRYTDKDYDFCKRANRAELTKSVAQSSKGVIAWQYQVNQNGYAGQPDGTCTIVDTLPAGLTYESAQAISDQLLGKIDSVETQENEDGTTTLTIKLSGLKHDEVQKNKDGKKYESDNNKLYGFKFKVVTKVSDSEYLYGATSKTFKYTNKASLTDRYGHVKTASATASLKHVAMKKSMTYTKSSVPYAQFTITANEDLVDLNPDGDTVGIVDVSSKTLSIDMDSIKVVDAKGKALSYTIDASKMASDNQFTIYVPDNTYVKITYQAQVVGATGQEVQVGNGAYFEGHKSTSDENTISQKVAVLKSSGQAKSEPLIWLSKKNESAQAIGGVNFRLDSYNQDTNEWTTVRDDIVTTDDSSSKGVKIDELELNTFYRLVETKAADGYVLDDTPHYFYLTRDENPDIDYPEGVSADDTFVSIPGTTLNVYNTPYTKVRFVKHGTDGTQLAGAEFAIYKVSDDGKVDDTPARDADGNEAVFTTSATDMNVIALARGTYKLVETKAPAGFEKSDSVNFEVTGNADRVVTVEGKKVQYGTGDNVTGAVEVVDTPKSTSLSVTKLWDDDNDKAGKRRGSVTVQLFADGVAVDGSTVELNNDNNWTASFNDLKAGRDDGHAIVYTVKELDPDNNNEPVDFGSKLTNGYTVNLTYASYSGYPDGEVPIEEATAGDSDSTDSGADAAAADAANAADTAAAADATGEQDSAATDGESKEEPGSISYTITNSYEETPVQPDEPDNPDNPDNPDQPYAKTGAQAPDNNLGLIFLVAAIIAAAGVAFVVFATRRPGLRLTASSDASCGKHARKE